MWIRRADPKDAERFAELIIQLGYPATAEPIAAKLAGFARSDLDDAFVAERDGEVVGIISVHAFELFHVPGRLGRITSLVVDHRARGGGVGRALVAQADTFFRSRNCVRAEVTSGEHRTTAHRFYVAQGYIEDERRFIKTF